MRYKVGDEVVIRTWEDMVKEYDEVRAYNVDSEGHKTFMGKHIQTPFYYFQDWIEERISKERVATITMVIEKTDDKSYYVMEGMATYYQFTDEMIKCKKTYIPIDNRFEIMDL